ncbi:suppressor of Hairy wing [Arctopsyche grandis]|uniref:suppressor of Hairy wing n=1 Tax=Arctopsyche grandis TaxID=121162 RepID=UPI00406D7FE9
MTSTRRSSQNFQNSMAIENVIVIVETPNGGRPVEQITKIKTSLIEYMCNRCNKKYTTNLGLKRHLKFCNDSDNDIQIQIPMSKNIDDTQNNNLPSQNMNLNIEKATIDIQADNPYEFNDDDIVNSAEENCPNGMTADASEDVCECCGEDKSTAHKAGDLKCVSCNKYYKHKEKFDLHLKRFHSTSKKALKCSQCKVKCEDGIAFLEHMKIHDRANTISCPTCKKNFTRKYHLERHLKQIGCDGRKTSSFTCEVCDRVFARKDNLREHLRYHIGFTKKTFTCDYCSKNFHRRQMFITHIRTHTGESPFKCSFCSKCNKTKGALVKHERTHTGEKPYSCKQCGRAFSAKETLNRHVKTHLEDKPIVCLECGKTFIQISQLRNHLVHHTGLSIFKCKYCDVTFTQKSKLKAHEKHIHEGVEKLTCDTDGCTKSFITKDDLKRHQRIHTDVKPYQCKQCDKRFRTSGQKSSHERVHKREPPRRCSKCPRAFIRADCLLRHMRNKHPDDYKALVVATRKNKLEVMKAKLNIYKNAIGNNNSAMSDNSCELIKSSDTLDTPSASVKAWTMSDNSCDASADSEDVQSSNENELMSFPMEKVKQAKFTNEALVANVEELITLLVDKDSLDAFGWPHVTIDKVLEDVIKKCGCEPVLSKMGREEKLRENTKLLLTVVIDDASMKKLVDTHTIDEVILHVLQLGKSV